MKPTTLPDVSALSPADKLRLIEVLWDDLERMPNVVESPAWHEAVLNERAAAYKAGKMKFRPLSEVKKSLRVRGE